MDFYNLFPVLKKFQSQMIQTGGNNAVGLYVFFKFFFMDIATAKAKANTRAGYHTQTNTHPSTQPLTWQHAIKSLAHRKQVNGSTLSTSRGHRNNLLLPEGTFNVEIHNIKFRHPGWDSNPDCHGENQTC